MMAVFKVVIIVVVSSLIHMSLVATTTFPKCDSDQKYKDMLDLSFDTVGNKTIFGVCNYPNPRSNFVMCGRSKKSFLCDPDAILSKEQADILDDQLNATYNKTFCRCKEKCSDIYFGHPMAVLLLDELRVPDRSGQVCTGGACGELYPQIIPESRTPSDSEQESALQTFNSEILRRWQLGRCSDAVVVVYWAKYQRVSVAAGELAQEMLRDIFESSLTSALIEMDSGRGDGEEGGRNIRVALSGLIRRYADTLEHPKRWPLYLGITLAVVAGLLIIFGLVMTIIFCRREFQQGKTCSQVLHSCIGGSNAIVLGGNRPHTVPPIYEITKTSEDHPLS